MRYLKHGIAGLLIFALITSLFTTIYITFEENYDITRTADVDDKNIMERMQELNILEGVQDFTDAIVQFQTPGNVLLRSFEVLTGAGWGFIQIILGLLTIPFEITSIILLYYSVPGVIVTTINVIVIVYIGFILLRYLMKQE